MSTFADHKRDEEWNEKRDRIAQWKEQAKMTTQPKVEQMTTGELLACATALPWEIERGLYADAGQLFLRGIEAGNPYKQSVARLGYAYTKDGSDAREANAELIRRMAASFEALLAVAREVEGHLYDKQDIGRVRDLAASALRLSEGRQP